MQGWKAAAATTLIAASLAGLPGCDWWNAPADDGEEDPVLAAENPDAGTSAAAQQKIELHLKPGDRFPLLKTVEHTLRQPAEQGWSISRSNLEMLLSITVREIRPPATGRNSDDPRAGEKRLEVQYHRVQFSQQLPGRKKVEYNSDAPVNPIPPFALGYHGLKDNGFEFWLSKDNQIVELVAFDQFLDRCLRDVPQARQARVRTSMAATSGADGIANFVDDSIGLLPTSAVREGDSWTRDRQVLQPVPMHCSTRYVLRRITDEVAEIDIVGTLTSLITYNLENQPVHDVDVAVRGGQSIGTCILDRRTGLPLHSKVEQSLDMTVRVADGSEFDQHKSTVTTVKYFPEQGGARTVPGASPTSDQGDVVHAAGEAPADDRPPPRR
ncbi:MAG: hypothetical protein HY290_16715 [Planctomycetia bacterium]|nr:hypothetical protein [Planctomycetia bacterium]